LQGLFGDALRTIGCAAGYNLRWLLRAIARLGIGVLFASVAGSAGAATRHSKLIRYAWALVDDEYEQLVRRRAGQETDSWLRHSGCFLNSQFCMAD
jgi:hypothetical protein